MNPDGELHSGSCSDRGKVLLAWFSPDRWPRWLVYVLPVVLVAATLLCRLAIPETFGERPLLILFVLPILLSAYLGGLGPGLVATLTASLGVNFLLFTATPTLGLRIVSGLASQLGGRLTMEQPDGLGSAFQVVFPTPEDFLTKDNAA